LVLDPRPAYVGPEKVAFHLRVVFQDGGVAEGCYADLDRVRITETGTAFARKKTKAYLQTSSHDVAVQRPRWHLVVGT